MFFVIMKGDPAFKKFFTYLCQSVHMLYWFYVYYMFIYTTFKQYKCYTIVSRVIVVLDIISCNEFLNNLWDMFFIVMKDDPAFKKKGLCHYTVCVEVNFNEIHTVVLL